MLPYLNRFVLIVMFDFALKQTSMNAKCFQMLATRTHIATIMLVLIAALVCLDTLAMAQSASVRTQFLGMKTECDLACLKSMGRTCH